MKANMIKEKCIEQNQSFQKWDRQQRYQMFHHSHYDWWAFPINQPSSHGDKYQIGEQQFNKLLSDNQFITALKSNAILVCKSWGYNLSEGRYYSELQRNSDQRWQKWPIRLYKMTKSLELFQQHELFKHAIRYGNDLIRKGYRFVYSMRKLNEYFEKNQSIGKEQFLYKQIIDKNYEKSKSVYKYNNVQRNQRQLDYQHFTKSTYSNYMQKYNNMQRNQGQFVRSPLVKINIKKTNPYEYRYSKNNVKKCCF